jgi:hypothetical protein
VQVHFNPVIYLKNKELTVSILDPVQDCDKFGSRYCTGGYVWQVDDEKLGSLLSGPLFPAAADLFGGQGAPEVFEIALGSDTAQVGEDVCVLGVGMVRRESSFKPFHVRDNPTVTRFTKWNVEAGENSESEILMSTSQSFRNCSANILRRVQLKGRELISQTEVTNSGEDAFPLRWFAHPFFPPTETLCRFSLECSVPPNPAFKMDEEGFIHRIPEYDWNKGFFQPLQSSFGYPLHVEQKHPKLATIGIDCDFPLAWLPIWGNACTFSFEPYFHTVLQSGTKTSWAIRYRF